MSAVTGLTFGGKTWTPEFAQAIDKDKCIGCGRCYKVCGYNVLTLKALDEDGEFVDDEDDDEIERKVMVIANQDNCIGCKACSRICPKNCYTHAALNN
ncbi:ferredoxin III, nif-specific [Mastigocoleus sp. MO_188.B34]|uniref:ferredoxin III, nif-specific n=1 Tax=Mastigocoleus sp. MO_188.B34 TaxID=3036635 RepID=UPI00262284BA|nr:ferredoxin III, nif-specific [Mastigocoleus sp. MO_188.B34]MDJ0692894.1 ferredoxin III, nif-specific [Mastigocoleus sp. MO_188.B34]